MITLTIDGAVAMATLSQAPVNAMNDAWVARLEDILAQLEHEQNLSVLWLRSDQRVFCAGADLEFMRSRFLTAEGRELMIAFTQRLQQVFERLERLSLVSIAEIGGAALGGGFELALACDLRYVAETAKIGLPEARLGLLPAGGGTQRLTRLCGHGVARRLILGAEIVTGSVAVDLGLAHWAAPLAELQSATRSAVERIAELPKAALAESKRCIAAAANGRPDGYEIELAGSARLLAMAETQQRVQRFLDKSA
ncbi:MAG: enoyl-CoA hydratase/isomerase family protein [Sterolibacterium sp.]|jgi:enoyl-CoA hydratase/carnithine racemase